MSANELAKELGVPTNRLTQIMAGKRGISGDTALRLGKWFGTGPDIWMNLKAAAPGGGHELFNLTHGDMFSVVRHFVRFPRFFTGRKPAPILGGVFAIGTK